MPPTGSDMAAVVFKDPYRLDCLDTADPHREREVEQALIDHIQWSERFLGQHRSRKSRSNSQLSLRRHPKNETGV
jgi:predicted nuclease of restriction endonuclease-like (RecB) superfamily